MSPMHTIDLEDRTTLSAFQASLVRSAFAGRVEIVRARHLQPMRPCPILVDTLVDGGETAVVLRIARNEGGVEREASIYPTLKQSGWPVPTILAGPTRDHAAPGLFSMAVVERLAGDTLSVWAERSDEGRRIASETLAEAYRTFQAVPGAASTPPALSALPRRTLRDELDEVTGRRSDWQTMTEVQGAIARLRIEIDRIEVPLMFSNGDFAPANFLSDGVALTGMLDFEKAAFVDPLMVLTRFPVYDLRPFSRTGWVDQILAERGYTRRDFAIRVAVFCLRTLQTKVPVEGGTPDQRRRRRHVLGVLGAALEDF